jgi:hypothetical protein
MSLGTRVASALRTRYARALALETPDADLWASLSALAELHQPALEMQAGQLRCQECNGGKYGRVWPCHTLRVLATGLGIEMKV